MTDTWGPADVRAMATGERAQLLDEAVIRHLRPAVGRRLTSVIYAALDGEIVDASDLTERVVCIGGEVILHFEALEWPVFITWAENAGWTDHFSIQVLSESACRVGTLVGWPANDLPLWRRHIGSPLVLVRLFGLNGTPHILELAFPDGQVLLGDGFEVTFGDGDDLVARAGDDPSLLDGWDVMWSSS